MEAIFSDSSWLKRIALQFITEREFEKIERTSVKLEYKKGEVILKQGNQPTHVAYLQQGVVKFSYQNENSKRIILSIVAAPKILGGANLFYKDNNLFSIVAVEDCSVILMDSKVLLELLSNNGKLAVALYQIAAEMFKKSILNFVSVASKQKEGRIADTILYLSEDVYRTSDFPLSLTRKELAEFACCSPENVIMTLSKWQAEQTIDLSGKQLRICDLDKLKQISKIG
ncbi:Crp/Fnr family transcriptional regulator [uncultured Acetobacteroides sp.]|uniref:Crp/Fnr family transcriptional regulator n=1 Tax=uncultured Acetobacteroides sp. TaxID=1760811 RepID=UPI0029F5BFFC|nr:Crp/Fnr family transcriptional regulator [uncultured Acetobacteroides sp.]